MTVSADERAALDAMSAQDLAIAWCTLNNGDVPAPLASVFPANWQTMERRAQHLFAWPLMAAIIERIGLKACLRQWNIERMSDPEFEVWWKGSGGRLARDVTV